MDVAFPQAPKWVIQRPGHINLFINNHQTPPTYGILPSTEKKQTNKKFKKMHKDLLMPNT